MTHFSDRSRYESHGKCARRRFWGYHYTDGQPTHRGLNGVGAAEDLLFGLAVHHYLEDAFRVQIRDNEHFATLHSLLMAEATPDGENRADEMTALFLGLTATFSAYNLPSLLEEYEFIDAEQEYAFMVGDTKWMGRFDIILRRKFDGLWFNLEAKTSSFPAELLKGSSMNFQLLMEQHGMATHYRLKDEQVGGSLLLVFNKGRKQRASAKEQEAGRDGFRRLSPFTYLYQKEYVRPMGKVVQTPKASYADGWERLPAWTVPGWTGTLAASFEQERRDQVQVYPSVSFDRERLESVLRQVGEVERRMAQGDSWLKYDNVLERTGKIIVDLVWPQTFTNCHNDGGFGKPCPFLSLCQSPQMASDPIGSEEFEWRTANHGVEFENAD